MQIVRKLYDVTRYLVPGIRLEVNRVFSFFFRVKTIFGTATYRIW